MRPRPYSLRGVGRQESSQVFSFISQGKPCLSLATGRKRSLKVRLAITCVMLLAFFGLSASATDERGPRPASPTPASPTLAGSAKPDASAATVLPEAPTTATVAPAPASTSAAQPVPANTLLTTTLAPTN